MSSVVARLLLLRCRGKAMVALEIRRPRWREDMESPGIELAGIYIYPVKSLRGIHLEEVTLESRRLPGDRLCGDAALPWST